MPLHPRRSILLAAAPLALAACAHRAEIASAPDPVAIPPRPTLAAGLSAVKPPPREADGAYRTINSGLDPDHVVWHLRAALNVAAIGCRGAADAGTVPAYNAMLAAQKAALAHANIAVRASVRATGGDADAYMTRLYNYFAMPAAKPGFCAAAATLAPQAAATAPQGFIAFAETALPAIEAPFLAVYAQVDEYRVASAAWDDRYAAAAPTRVAEAGTPASADALTGDSPTGSTGTGGHRDTPRVATARERVAFGKDTKAPRLGYVGLDAVVAWQPARYPVYAAR